MVCCGLGYLQDHVEYLIRFTPTKDDAAGSATIPTEVRESESLWMLVLHFDCAGRGKSMFRDQEKADLLAGL